jgi:pSer/pThr/pTyr-binding forkhead associated (FHA) protein
MATEVARFERRHASTTIGRTEGDIRFPDDQFLSPIHSKLSWEEDRLEVRDLGSRNGTWVFLEAPHLLADGDLILIGSQVLRFRRLGYPGPHTAEADATKRMGSMVPSAARGAMQLRHGSRIMVGDKLLRVELPGGGPEGEAAA